MVPLPSTHHALLSDPEMLHEKFIRDFIARQYEESVEPFDMEAVWYNMVELVLGYGGALFRIDPGYLVYAGETTRGSVSRLPDDVPSFKVQEMVLRQADRNNVMYNLAAPYLRLPQKHKVQKSSRVDGMVPGWCLHDYIRHAAASEYNMVYMLFSEDTHSAPDLLHEKHRDRQVMAHMRSVVYLRVRTDDGAVLLDDWLDGQQGDNFAVFAHPLVVAYQFHYLSNHMRLEHVVPGYQLQVNDEQVIYGHERRHLTRQHTDELQTSWNNALDVIRNSPYRNYSDDSTLHYVMRIQKDFKFALPDVRSFFTWVLQNKYKFLVAWRRHIEGLREEARQDDTDAELQTFLYVSSSEDFTTRNEAMDEPTMNGYFVSPSILDYEIFLLVQQDDYHNASWEVHEGQEFDLELNRLREAEGVTSIEFENASAQSLREFISDYTRELGRSWVFESYGGWGRYVFTSVPLV